MAGGGSVRQLSQRAARMARAGQHGQAVAAWEQAERLQPGDPRVATGLGAALLAAERPVDALAWLGAACDRHPHDAVLLRLQAHALLRLGQRRPAIGALFSALDLEPGSIDTIGDLAAALAKDGAGALALPYARTAFASRPSQYGATLGTILLELGYVGDALEVADRALAAGADGAKLMILRSMALEAAGRGDEALHAARAAVRAAPSDPDALHGLATSLLSRGELTAEAWSLYEQRGRLIGMQSWPDEARRWRGEDPAGKTILVHAEQGLGDTLQFVRYVPMVAARGARVVLVVQPPLVRLLQDTPGAGLVTTPGTNLPPFDLYAPLLSLPGIFGTTLDSIPPPVPYRLAPKPPAAAALRVGLVWAGNSDFVYDRGRSLDPASLAPLAGVEGVTFHGLQLGATAMPLPGMQDAMEGVGDMADTARRIATLDLVIAADTGVAHLAATLGTPVWLLSRRLGCWRWLQDRSDTPWYPSMTIYRQRRIGDWAEVVDRVGAALAAAARAHGMDPS